MNEWGFIGQDILVGIGKFATSFKFKQMRGYEQLERLMHSNIPTHHSWPLWAILGRPTKQIIPTDFSTI